VGGGGYEIVQNLSTGRRAIKLYASALLHRHSQITCAVDKARRDALTLEKPLHTPDVHNFAIRYPQSSALTRAANRLTVSRALCLSGFSDEDRLSLMRNRYFLQPLQSEVLTNLSFSCIVYMVVCFVCFCLIL
jgi:hypothetical protein